VLTEVSPCRPLPFPLGLSPGPPSLARASRQPQSQPKRTRAASPPARAAPCAHGSRYVF